MSDFAERMILIKQSLEREIQSLKNSLEQQEDNLIIMNHFLKKYCEHQWTTDSIDIDPDRSQYIKYCLNCELQAPR